MVGLFNHRLPVLNRGKVEFFLIITKVIALAAAVLEGKCNIRSTNSSASGGFHNLLEPSLCFVTMHALASLVASCFPRVFHSVHLSPETVM